MSRIKKLWRLSGLFLESWVIQTTRGFLLDIHGPKRIETYAGPAEHEDHLLIQPYCMSCVKPWPCETWTKLAESIEVDRERERILRAFILDD